MSTATIHQPSVLVIQDISLVGRCSSMTALPVLCCAGLQCTLLPTALLSTHTGGFPNPWRRDLTADMNEILLRWSALPIAFDGIYIGYLASEDQFPVVDAVLERFLTRDTRLFVDPVMGDHGRRYAGCSEALTDGFRRLCRRADVIFPNATEAALLLGEAMDAAQPSDHLTQDQWQGLSGLGANAVIVTGLEEGERIGVGIAADGQETPAFVLHTKFPGSYPGTGDLFASCVVAGVLRGMDVPSACRLAADFMQRVMAMAGHTGKAPRFGVPFELSLAWLSDTFIKGFPSR